MHLVELIGSGRTLRSCRSRGLFVPRPHYGARRYGTPTDTAFDWDQVKDENFDPANIPDPELDEQKYRDARDWWKKLEEKDFSDMMKSSSEVDDDKEAQEQLEEMDKENPHPHVTLASVPLPEHPYPPELHPYQLKLRQERYEKNFEALSNSPDIIPFMMGFIDMKVGGFIPGAHWYHELIPRIQLSGDEKAFDMLVEEMRFLGYPSSPKVHSALVIQAMFQKDSKLVEQRWQEMLEDKFEPSYQLWTHKLTYYYRIMEDIDAAKKLFLEMQEQGFKDPLGYNLMIAMAKDHDMLEYADEIYKQMEDNGILEVDAATDTMYVELGDQRHAYVVKAGSVLTTESLMIYVADLRGDLKAAKYHLNRGHEIHTKFIKDDNFNKKWEWDVNLTQAIIGVHHKNGEWELPKKIMQDLITENKFPGPGLMIFYLKGVCETGQGKLFLETMLEYELYGFTYNEELCRAAMKMWYNVKDYRRFKNTWELCINLGFKPGVECSELMLKVYANTHAPYDVQKFYDLQVRIGTEITRDMHEIMLNDFLKRGFPGSARDIMGKMKEQGDPATQEQLEAIAFSYCSKGGGAQVSSLIKKEVDVPGSPYTMNANLLSMLLEGYAKSEAKENKTDYARKAWKKYAALVSFDTVNGTRAIEAFASMREVELALAVYERVKQEEDIKVVHGDDLFVAVLMAPPSLYTPLVQRMKVFDDLAQYKISATYRVYAAAMCLAVDHASPAGALWVIKKFVVENHGIPLVKRLCIEFLSAVVRFDSGEYSHLARAWINRIVPKQTETLPFLPNLRSEVGLASDLDKQMNDFLSVPQSLSFGKFVADIDPAKFVTPGGENEAYAELFSGGEADLEDILVHKYGKDISAVQEALHDPEYQIIKDAQARIERKRALLRAENSGKE